MTNIIRKFAMAVAVTMTLGAALAPGAPATAQGLFDAVITVNGAAITRFELQQREKLLELLRAPADPRRLSREQLIDDRLKMQAASAQGVVVSEELVQQGMEQFASQGNLTAEQMIGLLGKAGVSEETFRDFVRAGVTWRELTRARFGAHVSVSEEDLERARDAISHGTGVRVLLSEIIIPYTPESQEQVQEIARQIAQVETTGAFSAAASKYSVTPTRDQGGHLPWTPITKLPPVLRPLVLGLAPGEVSDPIPLEGAIALFQMRDIEETGTPDRDYAAIEYAAYYIAGGRTAATLARAAKIAADSDTCDDLYGVAKGQPPEVLDRGSKAPDEIPDDIAIELSKLDPGEVSTALTRANGQTLVLLMLCGRSETIEEDTPVAAAPAEGETAMPEPSETEQLSQQIANRRLDSFAQGYLEQLRAEARIVEK